MTHGLTKSILNADEVLYSACMFKILTTAEAARDLPEIVRNEHSDVDWKGLINMGNVLKHQYFRVESDVVWDTIQTDFPLLLAAVDRMISAEQMVLAEAAE